MGKAGRRERRADVAPAGSAARPARSARAVWAGAFALALVPRVVLLAQLHDHALLQPEGELDGAVYVRLARRAAAGEWAVGPDVYFVSPLYLYVLALLFRASGASLLAAQSLQVLLGAVGAALAAGAADLLFGRRAAWVAGVLVTLTGVFAFNEVLVLQSALDPFLSALVLFLFARALVSGAGRAWLAAGLAGGALCANRPNAVVALAACLLVHLLVRRDRSAARQAGLFVLGLALATAPFTARNRVVAGDWVWLTSHGGLNLYIGNHGAADGRYRTVDGIPPTIEGQATGARRVAERARGGPLPASEVSAYFTGRALLWVTGHPVDALRLFVRKVHLTLGATDLALNYSYTYYAGDERTILRALVVGPWLLVPLGLLGLVAHPRLRHPRTLVPWLAFVPASVLSVAVFFVATRYRLPLLVALAVTAGAAAAHLATWLAERRIRSLAGSAVALAGLATLTLWPIVPDEGRAQERTERIVRFVRDGRSEDARRLLARTRATHPAPALLLYRVGRAHADVGAAGEAIPLLEEALRASPGDGEAAVRMALAQSLLAHGRLEDARAELRRLTFPPDTPEPALLAVGQLALHAGEPAVAAAALAEAVRRNRGSAVAFEAYGVALEAAGRREDGLRALSEACRLDPASASARYNLAVLLARDGRLQDARERLQEVLRLAPGHAPARALLAEVEQAR